MANDIKPNGQKPTIAEALAVLRESGLFDLLRTGDLSAREREEIVTREMDAFKALVGRTAEERTQEKADKSFVGSKKFRIGLPDGNMHPVLTIAAESDTDAVARYNQICGIRFTEHQHVVCPDGSKAAKNPETFARKGKGAKAEKVVAEPAYGPA